MRILMVSAEYAPLAKAGGLADMVTGLSRALVAAGHDVRVVLPRYGGMAPGPLLRDGEQVSPVAVGGTHPAYGFQQLAPAPGREPLVYLVDCPALFGSGGIYGGGELEARRFALLSHAALHLCELLGWAPEIIHCHDWHAALVPVLLRTGHRASRVLREASSVLTIHNIGYQGVFAGTLAPDLGLAAATPAPAPAADLNFLRDGIVAADALTTVSPTHAAEILTAEYGKGLDALLRQRRNRLMGILNGVDYAAWDPATDPALPARFDARALGGRQVCREALIARAGLGASSRTPLLGMVTRLAAQKGIELVVDALRPLLRQRDVQAVIVGQGEERYATGLRQMAAEFPDLLHYFDVQDENLARLVFAGSDAFLVPSIYEPCGLTQMYALRYGAVPIVRETGGLKDTVRHFDVRTRSGTGSVFEHADGAGLAWAIGEALAWYRQPELWSALQQNGMAEDFSWRHQAPLYEGLYTRLTGTV
ncbi:MAG: glycogen synthase [Chromatiales bacterium]|nr:glycogen synthase [Chromatiales bacterium]